MQGPGEVAGHHLLKAQAVHLAHQVQQLPLSRALGRQGHGTRDGRLDPDNPWVRFAKTSIAGSSAQRLALLPNLAGTPPNDIFAEVLRQERPV
ncbi:hypothetical protein [Pseudomonas idahonensis]|uniref:hypothetical protein n=1 Tax=Pseudomonas idahonensis TaxID=2942628 RepID=UPI0035BF3771